jgi:hypothetical protein
VAANPLDCLKAHRSRFDSEFSFGDDRLIATVGG